METVIVAYVFFIAYVSYSIITASPPPEIQAEGFFYHKYLNF